MGRVLHTFNPSTQKAEAGGMSKRHPIEAKTGILHRQTCVHMFAQLMFEQKGKQPESIHGEQVTECSTSVQWDAPSHKGSSAAGAVWINLEGVVL